MSMINYLMYMYIMVPFIHKSVVQTVHNVIFVVKKTLYKRFTNMFIWFNSNSIQNTMVRDLVVLGLGDLQTLFFSYE